MERRKKELIVGLIILFILGGANIFIYKKNTYVSGYVVQIGNYSLNLNFSIVAFIVQWVFVLIIAILILMRYLKKSEKSKIIEKEISGEVKRKDSSEKIGETDIDTLYSLLKEKKSLKISTLAKIFKVKKSVILDWCKILENQNLVVINYPAFSGVEVKIKTKENH